jgi:site-specific DNA-methyltransferase (adenine-specific)
MIKLLHGDCLELMKAIPNSSIDAIITDPPYGTTACKWDSVIPFEPMWEQLKRIIKPNGAIVLFGSQPFSSLLICSNIKEFKYDWVWQKPKGTGHLNAKKMPMKDKEDILVFYTKQCTYNPQFSKGTPYKNKAGQDFNSKTSMTESYGKYTNFRNDNNGVRYPKQVLKMPVVERGTLHPTQKPVELLEYLIKTYTNENNMVLDFTMGSGTTGVACKNLNRNFIGIKLDEGYFNIAKERIGD